MPFSLSTNGCMSSSPPGIWDWETSDGLMHELIEACPRSYSPKKPALSRQGRSLEPMVPASFLSRPFLLDSDAPQSSRRSQSPPSSINCSSQGPRACSSLEPLTSLHSSASTYLAYHCVPPPTVIGHMLDIQSPNCLQPYFRSLQEPETFINSPIP